MPYAPTPRKGKTFEQRFIEELKRQCAGKDVAISNKSLRESLKWKDERFNLTRDSLIKKGIVKAAQGHGGKTKFSEFDKILQKRKSLRAFISYSHKDEDFKNEFVKHLHPLEKLGLIENWYDNKIQPGDHISDSVFKEMSISDIVFLLISIDYLNSDFCYNKEMQTALSDMKKRNIKVIPIILRDCFWKKTPFKDLKSLPKDGKSIISYINKDEAYTSIAEEIFNIVEKGAPAASDTEVG